MPSDRASFRRPSDIPITVDDVRDICLFAGATEAELERVCPTLSRRPITQRTSLLFRDSFPGMLCFVQCGSFRLTAVSPRGAAITLYEARPGEMIGHVAAILGEQFSPQVRLVTDKPGQLLTMSATDFAGHIRNIPSVCHAVVRALALTSKAYAARVYELGTLNVAMRLNGELLRMARLTSVECGRRILKPAPTHATLAACIGATREAVSRQMNKLEHEGIVERERGSIEFLDMAKLEAMDAADVGARFSGVYEQP